MCFQSSFFLLKSALEQSKLKNPQEGQSFEGTDYCYMKQVSYVVSFTMVCNLHRVTIVTRGLAKKLSGYIYF